MLAAGFCAFVESFAPTAAADTGEQPTLWQRPMLQIVDIQRYVADVIPRFYLALSDGKGLLWAVLPPGALLDRAISAGDVDVGVCVVVEEYGIVAAANGRRVIVIASAVTSGGTLSLVGDPSYDAALFKLSRKALTAKPTVTSAPASIPVASLAQIWDNAPMYEDGAWELRVRALWKSKLRKLMNHPSQSAAFESRSNAAAAANSGRYVFDVKVVDGNGDSAQVVLWGSRLLYDIFEVGSVVSLGHGSIRYSATGLDTHPVSLHFNDRSRIIALPDDPAIPRYVTRELGDAACAFLDVTTVLSSSNIGDLVCVRGVVVRSAPAGPVVTRSGSTMRRTIRIRDCTMGESAPHLLPPTVSTQFPPSVGSGAGVGGAAAGTIEVTLWDEASQQDPQVGSIWCFRDFVVRTFGQSKVLSSRHSSEAFIEPSRLGDMQAVSLAATQQEQQPSGTDVRGADLAFFDPSNEPLLDSLAAAVREGGTALAKVAELRVPVTYCACRQCGRRMSRRCPQCDTSESEPRFMVTMRLSDGISELSATGFALVGEALFGESAADFAVNAETTPFYEQDVATRLLGHTVMVTLSRAATSDAHVVVGLRHVDLRAASLHLLDVIAGIQNGRNTVDGQS